MYSSVNADDESMNPIVSVAGVLQRRSTNEEFEQRKVRLSSSENERHSFIAAPSEGLTTREAEDLLARWGRNELEDKKVPKVVIVIII